MTLSVSRFQSTAARRYGWVLVCLVTGVGFGVARYGDLGWGNEVVNPDLRRMFRPLARGVAEGGQLYGPGLADNKPPLWHLLNVGAYLTGEYLVAVLLAVGVANGVAAALLWRWLTDRGAPELGVLAGAFFLLVLPLAGGHHVNSRALMLPFLVGAFAARRPSLRGGAVAGAALSNAYAALFVPVLCWRVWHDAAEPRRAVAAYLASGAGVGAAVFGFVGAVWGLDAANAALHWSYGFPLVLAGVETGPVHPAAASPGSYLSSSWLLTRPRWWVSYAGTRVLQLLPVLALAGLGWSNRDRLPDALTLAGTLTAALAAGFVPFLFRAYEQYWLVSLPFLAVLAAVGAATVTDTVGEDPTDE